MQASEESERPAGGFGSSGDLGKHHNSHGFLQPSGDSRARLFYEFNEGEIKAGGGATVEIDAAKLVSAIAGDDDFGHCSVKERKSVRNNRCRGEE